MIYQAILLVIQKHFEVYGHNSHLRPNRNCNLNQCQLAEVKDKVHYLLNYDVEVERNFKDAFVR